MDIPSILKYNNKVKEKFYGRRRTFYGSAMRFFNSEVIKCLESKEYVVKKYCEALCNTILLESNDEKITLSIVIIDNDMLFNIKCLHQDKRIKMFTPFILRNDILKRILEEV